MRRAAKVDANQAEIVAAFRRLGASVQCCHAVGGGFPDLVVGFRGLNALVEVKDGSKPPSARKLTSDQIDFHHCWRGEIAVVETVADVERLIRSMQ